MSSPRVLGCHDDEHLASRRIDDRNTSRQDVSDPAIAPERPWRTRGGVAHVLSAVLSPKSRAAKDAAQRAATTAALRSVSVDGAIGKGCFATARHTLCGTTGTASRVLIPGGRDSPLVSSRVSSATVPVQAVPTKGKRTSQARPPRFRGTLLERCLQPWIDRFALEREDAKPHSCTLLSGSR